MMSHRTLPILLCVLLTGCGLLKRPKNTFFSLDTIPAAAPATTIGGTPIGIDGIASKDPAAIAVSVAARILQLIEETAARQIG